MRALATLLRQKVNVPDNNAKIELKIQNQNYEHIQVEQHQLSFINNSCASSFISQKREHFRQIRPKENDDVRMKNQLKQIDDYLYG